MSRHLGWRLLAVLLLIGAAGWMAVTRPARLGLDLRGGTQIVLEAKNSPDRHRSDNQVDDGTLSRTLEVLRRRVDQLGVAEPTLQRSGDRRVIVELPGSTTPRRPPRSSAAPPSSPSTRSSAWRTLGAGTAWSCPTRAAGACGWDRPP